MIENIEHNGRQLAIVLRAVHQVQGTSFITPPEEVLQLGILGYPAGHVIRPHRHAPQRRCSDEVQEVLHVASGRITVSFFGDDSSRLSSVTLDSGDTILLLRGGHSVRVDEDCRLLEMKTGPYSDDKVYLDTEGQP